MPILDQFGREVRMEKPRQFGFVPATPRKTDKTEPAGQADAIASTTIFVEEEVPEA